jgi:hypothetical protein
MTSKNGKSLQFKYKKDFMIFPDKLYLLEALKSIIREIKTSEVELFKKKKSKR